MTNIIDLVRLGWNKPPKTIARWVLRKIKARRAARSLPRWERWLGPASLAAALDHSEVSALIESMRRANPFPGLRDPAAIRARLSPENAERLKERAETALRREVDLLGSGPVYLGERINWTLDFKSGTAWPMDRSLSLPVNDLGQPSDIKVPWELSRLQWLLPVGQAYVLFADERYAEFAREIIEDWMIANPVCRGPNWVCAMDVAIRAISMLWLFHACKPSAAWRDPEFAERLAKSLLLHGRFIETNLEFADVNGNHLSADLAGLTVIGVGLGGTGMASTWVEMSWQLLTDEFPKQVPDDGVCREASLPYHRLVAELFLLPALARKNVGLPVDDAYLARLRSMAVFSRAATRPDGEVPVWGDADDGRALPLGTQTVNDHRYLPGLLCGALPPPETPGSDEVLWWLGAGAPEKPSTAASAVFPNAGAIVLRGKRDHVFVDAGPVGMAGRGGHGHNDCLSFEATLRGQRLVVDPGAYVYTADWEARNRFRATAAHNSPFVDGEEINRLVDPRYLWLLHDDAQPTLHSHSFSSDMDLITASHSGYQRLPDPVTPVRTLMLDKADNRMFVVDRFEGTGEHTVSIKLTFAPGVSIEKSEQGVWRLNSPSEDFLLVVADDVKWSASTEPSWYSPSYGVVEPVDGLIIERTGRLRPLAFAIFAAKGAPADPAGWLLEQDFVAAGPDQQSSRNS